MDLNPALLIGVIGTAAGIFASGLGLTALNHLRDASATDRVVGWTLWWWADAKRYDAEGQRLCRRGAFAFGIGAVCWLLAGYLWRQ